MARILLTTLLAAAAALAPALPAGACHPPPASLGCPDTCIHGIGICRTSTTG